MQIGIPKEIKDQEYRVGATPAIVKALVAQGHKVAVQADAGAMVDYTDAHFEEAGASIVKTAEAVYDQEMVIKVKEPQKSECDLLKEGQLLFCFLHLSADKELTDRLIEKKVVAIAFETVTNAEGKLPLLMPMSEIAGRVSVQVGATCLQMNHGGRGVLLGAVPGVVPARVVVVGAGTVGTEAVRMALGLGAQVTLLDNNLDRLRALDLIFGPRLRTQYSTVYAIEKVLKRADLVIGAVLSPGKKTDKLITKKMLKEMKHGSVLVDVAIDQGGIAETSRPTTLSAPTYEEEGVVHYCVTNMPATCARTATEALSNAILPYLLALAKEGYSACLKRDPHFLRGLNLFFGQVTCEAVARDLGYSFVSPEEVL